MKEGNHSKTVDFINKFYDIVKGIPTDEEKEFIRNYEITIAASLIKDFGEEGARRIADIIVAAIR